MFHVYCEAIIHDLSTGSWRIDVLKPHTDSFLSTQEICLSGLASCLAQTPAVTDDSPAVLRAASFARSIVPTCSPCRSTQWTSAGRLATAAIIAENKSRRIQFAILSALLSREDVIVTLSHGDRHCRNEILAHFRDYVMDP